MGLPRGHNWLNWFLNWLEVDEGSSWSYQHFFNDVLSSRRVFFFWNLCQWLLGALVGGGCQSFATLSVTTYCSTRITLELCSCISNHRSKICRRSSELIRGLTAVLFAVCSSDNLCMPLATKCYLYYPPTLVMDNIPLCWTPCKEDERWFLL